MVYELHHYGTQRSKALWVRMTEHFPELYLFYGYLKIGNVYYFKRGWWRSVCEDFHWYFSKTNKQSTAFKRMKWSGFSCYVYLWITYVYICMYVGVHLYIYMYTIFVYHLKCFLVHIVWKMHIIPGAHCIKKSFSEDFTARLVSPLEKSDILVHLCTGSSVC